MLPEALAENALAVVALDRVTDPAAGNHTQPGRRLARYDTTLENKRSAVDTMTHAADFLKFAWPPKAH